MSNGGAVVGLATFKEQPKKQAELPENIHLDKELHSATRQFLASTNPELVPQFDKDYEHGKIKTMQDVKNFYFNNGIGQHFEALFQFILQELARLAGLDANGGFLKKGGTGRSWRDFAKKEAVRVDDEVNVRPTKKKNQRIGKASQNAR